MKIFQEPTVFSCIQGEDLFSPQDSGNTSNFSLAGGGYFRLLTYSNPCPGLPGNAFVFEGVCFCLIKGDGSGKRDVISNTDFYGSDR